MLPFICNCEAGRLNFKGNPSPGDHHLIVFFCADSLCVCVSVCVVFLFFCYSVSKCPRFSIGLHVAPALAY